MKQRLIALVLCCSLAAAAAASEAKRYTVGVEELDYSPIYALRNGEYVGAAREILDAFAADRGIVFSYRALPVTRLTGELINGDIDFKFPDNAHWNAELRKGKTIVYSQAVIACIDGVLVRPERRGQGVDQIRTLGTVTGFTPFAWLGRLKEGKVRLVENPQMLALQRQVLAGRIDGAYASVAVAYQTLEVELKQPGALVFDASLPHARSDYSLSSARHPELIRQFNAWLAANAQRVASIKEKSGAEKGVR